MNRLLAYLLRFPRTPNRQPAQLTPPHELWPEILHWQVGDKFDAHVDYRGKHYYSLRLMAELFA